MISFLYELRFTWRALRRSLTYTGTAVLTLTLAMVAAVVVLSVVYGVLGRALPFPSADRLVTVTERNQSGLTRLASYPTFRDWQSQSRAFSGLAYVRGATAILGLPEGFDRLTAGYVTPGFFGILEAQPLLGRVFSQEEEAAGANVVVVSYSLWSLVLGGDRSIVGRTIQLDSTAVTVIGVMPPGTTFPGWVDLWRPIAARVTSDAALGRRDVHVDSRVLGRLAPGASLARASSELATIQSRLATEYPALSKDWVAAELSMYRDGVVGETKPALLVAAAAVTLLFLIACGNIANLSIVRALARERELAVRTALGASKASIIRQFVIEAGVLVSLSTALSFAISVRAIEAVRAFAPPAIPRTNELRIDAQVFATALVLASVAVLLCGVLPSIGVARWTLGSTLSLGQRTGVGGRRAVRIRRTMVVVQLSLATSLLIGAALLSESFRKVLNVDLGFDPSRLITLRVFPPSPRYDGVESATGLYQRIIEAVHAVPGITAAAIVNHAPLSSVFVTTRIVVPGREPLGDDLALYKTVSLGYLETLGVSLQRGRWFSEADFRSRDDGVVISRKLAERYWPNTDPVGQPITVFRSSQARPGFGTPQPSRVIGVVGDVRHFGQESAQVPEVYVPFTREVWPAVALAARTSGDPSAVIPALRTALRAIDPAIPVAGAMPTTGFIPMALYESRALGLRRYLTWVLAGFSLSALLLGVIGLAGLTAYVATQRHAEIGIRLALGASPGRVFLLMLREGLVLIGLGVGTGLFASMWLTGFLRTLLFSTPRTDPGVLAVVATVTIVVALAACSLPAWRSSRLDPAAVLRA